MRSLFLLLLLLSANLSWSQISPEKLLGIQERSKWAKAERSIRKARAKDSLDAESAYLLSLFYFHSIHTSYNLDSASAYQHLAARLVIGREQGRRDVPDTFELQLLRVRIDSAAFEQAKISDSEKGYQYFIDHYASASQFQLAIELRDEIAFLEALRAATSKSFSSFLERYPTSHRQGEAQSRMEKLQYEEETKDGRLTSYMRFYAAYPYSLYRSQAEKHIFEMTTASGTGDAFTFFLDHYPESRWVERARSMLFEIRQMPGEASMDAPWMTDSLRRIEKVNAAYWVPIIKSGRYGFMDEKGMEIVTPRFESIPDEYRCGDITDRFLSTSQGLLSRNGSLFWPGLIKESKELGLGFILISSDSGRLVIHESGFRIGPQDIDDAQLISNQFIGVKKNGKWSVLSLVGMPLLPFAYDEVAVLDSVIQLTKNRKMILTTPGRISQLAKGADFQEDFVFDETRKWGEQHYWVRNGLLEGVINANLSFLIPLDRQALRKTSFGFLATKSDRVFIKGIKQLEDSPYTVVVEQAGWVRMENASGRHFLYDRGFGWTKEGDKVWFQGKLAFLQTVDSVNAFLPSGQKISFSNGSWFQFKEYKDSASWMVLQEGQKKIVFDAESGAKLFAAEFEQIDPVSPSLFILTHSNKKGMVQENGKVVLPIEYDAIVPSGDHAFSILKDRKFGWYNGVTNLLMKPIYDRNVKPYNDRFGLAYKDQGYGFIYSDGKPLGNNEWEDIHYWNDSVAWVMKDGLWKLLEIQTQKVILDKIKKFNHLKDSPTEKIALVLRDRAHGVISSVRGIIVPLEYTDIVNLGTKEIPLYFTEKHISEAGISVVVYYDQHGKIVRTQAMELNEFEKIFCDK